MAGRIILVDPEGNRVMQHMKHIRRKEGEPESIVSVIGREQVLKEARRETISQHQCEITFTGVGKRAAMIETVGNKCTLLRRQGEKGSENVLLWGSKCGLGAQSETLTGVRASQPHPVVEGPFELREGDRIGLLGSR